MAVERIHAREILDSRGNPTVEVDLYTHKGMWARIRGRASPAHPGSAGAVHAKSMKGPHW